MNNEFPVVQERITTVDDGPETVNERLTSGGVGPEGQPDTVVERLSGAQDEPASESDPEPEVEAEPEPEGDEASDEPKS